MGSAAAASRVGFHAGVGPGGRPRRWKAERGFRSPQATARRCGHRLRAARGERVKPVVAGGRGTGRIRWQSFSTAAASGAATRTGSTRRCGTALLRRGFAVASANYRLAPDARFPCADGGCGPGGAVSPARMRTTTTSTPNRFATLGARPAARWRSGSPTVTTSRRTGSADPVGRASSRSRRWGASMPRPPSGWTTWRRCSAPRAAELLRQPARQARAVRPAAASGPRPSRGSTGAIPPSVLHLHRREDEADADASRPNTFMHDPGFARPVTQEARSWASMSRWSNCSRARPAGGI